MNTADIAQKLDTTPKTLRRFLRSDDRYENAGSGGRYDFTDGEMTTLTKRFATWNDKNSGRRSAPANANGGPVPATNGRGEVADSTSDRIPVRLARRSTDPKTRAVIRALAEARVDRLESALMAAGLHISQSGVAKKSRV